MLSYRSALLNTVCVAQERKKGTLITRLKLTPSMGWKKDAAQVPSTEIKI